MLQVTDAVHAKGSFIYVQLWAGGRAIPRVDKASGITLYSASPIPVKGNEDTPVQEMTVDGERRSYTPR